MQFAGISVVFAVFMVSLCGIFVPEKPKEVKLDDDYQQPKEIDEESKEELASDDFQNAESCDTNSLKHQITAPTSENEDT